MSDEKIAFGIDINGVDKSINSIKDLRKAIKEAKDEQVKASQVYGESSEQYLKASKRVGELKDKVEDLNDSTRSLKGSGVEKVTSSFNLLGEGFRTFDTEKIKTGLKGVGSAMSAIPIFLLIEGLTYLVRNFDEVSGAIKKFFDITSDTEKEVRKLEQAASELKKTNEAVIGSLQDELKILEAQGASNEQVLAVKKEIIAQKIKELEIDARLQQAKVKDILLEDSLTESFYKKGAAIASALGDTEKAEKYELLAAQAKNERAKEALDKFKTDIVTINALKTDAVVEDIKANKKASDDYKKNLDKRKEDTEKYYEDLRKQSEQSSNEYNARIEKERQDYFNSQKEKLKILKEFRDAEAQYEANIQAQKNSQALVEAQLKVAQDQTDNEAKIALLETKRQIELQDLSLTNDQRALINQNYRNQEEELDKQSEQKKRAEKQKTLDTTLNATKQGLAVAQQLTDLYFSYQLAKNKGNAKAELEIRKKQFNINKAFGITNAVIDGVGAVQKALNNPYPLNIFLAVVSGLAAAANVAKIASTKFDTGGSGASAGGAGDAPSVPSPPSISTSSNNLNQNTKFDENGKNLSADTQPVIKVNATVGVDEITTKTNRVNVLEKQATF